jgi:hypothetical protein
VQVQNVRFETTDHGGQVTRGPRHLQRPQGTRKLEPLRREGLEPVVETFVIWLVRHAGIEASPS